MTSCQAMMVPGLACCMHRCKLKYEQHVKHHVTMCVVQLLADTAYATQCVANTAIYALHASP